MSTTGPKGPADATAMGRVLQFRRTETSPVTETAPVKAPSQVPEEEAPSAVPAAIFESTPGQTSQNQISAPVEGAALSQLIARLRARGDALGPVATITGPTMLQTSEGKVLSGSLQIEGKTGLQKLDGVVRVGGHLAIEGVMKNADLLVLRDLKVVEGRLTLEGLRSKIASD